MNNVSREQRAWKLVDNTIVRFQPFTMDLGHIEKLLSESEYNAIRLVECDPDYDAEVYNVIAENHLYDTLIHGELYTREQTNAIIESNSNVMYDAIMIAYTEYMTDTCTWINPNEKHDYIKVLRHQAPELANEMSYIYANLKGSKKDTMNAKYYNEHNKKYAVLSYYDSKTKCQHMYHWVDKPLYHEIQRCLTVEHNGFQPPVQQPKKPLPKPKARIKKAIKHHDDIQKGIRDSEHGKSATFTDTYIHAFSNYHDSNLNRYFDDNGHPTKQQCVLRCELATILESTYNI